MRKILFIFSFLLTLQICLPEESYAEVSEMADPIELTWTYTEFYQLFRVYQIWLDTDGDGVLDYYYMAVSNVSNGDILVEEEGDLFPEGSLGPGCIVIPNSDILVDSYVENDCIDNIDFSFHIAVEEFGATITKYCGDNNQYYLIGGPNYSSIKEMAKHDKARVWPQPSNSVINISLSDINSIKNISIIDINGHIVRKYLSFNTDNDYITLDIK